MVGVPSYPAILVRNPSLNLPHYHLLPSFFTCTLLTPSYPCTPSSYKKFLSLHLINAANLCVPVLWRNTVPPPVGDWIRWVYRMAEMEKLICQANNNPTKLNDTWACWLHYRKSTAQIASPAHPPPHHERIEQFSDPRFHTSNT